jgi:hypothetical protein
VPVEHPVVDGLVEMMRPDVLAAVEVGDGVGNAEHFVVGTSGEAQLGHRAFQLVLTLLIQWLIEILIFPMPESRTLCIGMSRRAV